MANPVLYAVHQEFERMHRSDPGTPLSRLFPLLLEAASPDTCALQVRPGWTREQPLHGHDDVIALIVQDLFAGRLVLTRGPDGASALGNEVDLSWLGGQTHLIVGGKLVARDRYSSELDAIDRDRFMNCAHARNNALRLCYTLF